jgi:hypothetical protein
LPPDRSCCRSTPYWSICTSFLFLFSIFGSDLLFRFSWLFLASLQFSLSDLRILTPWLFLAFFTIFAVRWAIFSLSYNFHLM